MNTHMNTSSKKPYRYKVCMNDQETDKGEVGGSSPPRPTKFTKPLEICSAEQNWLGFRISCGYIISYL